MTVVLRIKDWLTKKDEQFIPLEYFDGNNIIKKVSRIKDSLEFNYGETLYFNSWMEEEQMMKKSVTIGYFFGDHIHVNIDTALYKYSSEFDDYLYIADNSVLEKVEINSLNVVRSGNISSGDFTK